MKAIPLYDVKQIKDLRDMLRQSQEQFGTKTLFKVKDRIAARELEPGPLNGRESRSKDYLSITYDQYAKDVEAFATWLFEHGGTAGRVAVLGETRYEWYVTYMATVNGYGVIVPLDKELPDVELASLLARSDATILVYSASKKAAVDAIRGDLSNIDHFICMDAPETATDLYFWDCLQTGAALVEAGDDRYWTAPLNDQEMRILLFTSGTTARSKAVMLNHQNICINLMAMCQMVFIGPEDTFLSVLPIHHTYECTCGFLCQIYRGCTVAVSEGLRYIVQNLQESKATKILVVPLMLEAFYRRITKAATADPKLARKFNFGRKLSNFLLKLGIDRRRKLFDRIHQNFGGEMKLMIAGGAAIDPAILSGMQELGFHCLQGYGLTECAPILALNRDVDYKNESAGLPLPGVDIKIINKDEEGIGEIIGKGGNVMIGYYQNPEATAAAIDEAGYYHTGDLGYIDEDGFLIITGRMANLIVTKNGKNIYPEEIEFLLLQSDYIAEVVISGEKNDRGDVVVTAEIFPDAEAIAADPELQGEALDSEKVRAKIGEIIRETNHKLVTYKYVRDFSLRNTEFEKTTSRKIRRRR